MLPITGPIVCDIDVIELEVVGLNARKSHRDLLFNFLLQVGYVLSLIDVNWEGILFTLKKAPYGVHLWRWVQVAICQLPPPGMGLLKLKLGAKTQLSNSELYYYVIPRSTEHSVRKSLTGEVRALTDSVERLRTESASIQNERLINRIKTKWMKQDKMDETRTTGVFYPPRALLRSASVNVTEDRMLTRTMLPGNSI
jgi:hypothetical protein